MADVFCSGRCAGGFWRPSAAYVHRNAFIGDSSPPMPCLQISEDEAILLGLWRDFSLGDAANASATLALLTEEKSVGAIASAMRAAIDRRVAAGFEMSALAADAMTHQESIK